MLRDLAERLKRLDDRILGSGPSRGLLLLSVRHAGVLAVAVGSVWGLLLAASRIFAEGLVSPFVVVDLALAVAVGGVSYLSWKPYADTIPREFGSEAVREVVLIVHYGDSVEKDDLAPVVRDVAARRRAQLAWLERIMVGVAVAAAGGFGVAVFQRLAEGSSSTALTLAGLGTLLVGFASGASYIATVLKRRAARAHVAAIRRLEERAP